MSKQHYYFKLIPPRPSFPQDITAEEKALMDDHGNYFAQQFDAGKLLLYGPVMALYGAFGVGILEVADADEARKFGENDPSVRAGMNRFEVYPMWVSNARREELTPTEPRGRRISPRLRDTLSDTLGREDGSPTAHWQRCGVISAREFLLTSGSIEPQEISQ